MSTIAHHPGGSRATAIGHTCCVWASLCGVRATRPIIRHRPRDLRQSYNRERGRGAWWVGADNAGREGTPKDPQSDGDRERLAPHVVYEKCGAPVGFSHFPTCQQPQFVAIPVTMSHRMFTAVSALGPTFH